ncbi:ATP-binding protein [Flavobacterium sp.]|uniref:ATP-binding protein n=1 Tax=Flavobacterium sp. TaxID=239 RepID=UPI00260FB466|nr:ATP-binding protein [Flavobacterium sp.]
MEEEIIKDSIFRIGCVTSVDGRAIRVSVDKAKNSSHLLYKGELVKNVSVGSYIKIIKGFTKIIGKVEGEYTIEDKNYSNKEYSSDKEKISRTLNVSLLGFFNKKHFERGIKEMPLIDNECYLLDREEFNKVHDFIRKDDEPLTIGTLTLEKGQEIQVGIDSLFASHIGIFGNTGSGKSYTLAKIYRELFKKYKDQQNFQLNAKFFLIDFNGEYVDDNDNIIVEKEYKQIYKLSTKISSDKFPVSSETLYEPSFWAVILEATEKTQTPFLRRAISNSWIAERLDKKESLKELIISRLLLALDKNDKELGSTIIVDFLSEINKCIPDSNISQVRDVLREHLEYHNTTSQYMFIMGDGSKLYSDNMRLQVAVELNKINLENHQFNDLDKLKLQILFQYYDDIIKGHSNREHLSPLIKRMEKRFEDIRKVIKIDDNIQNQKNFTIVSLKDVNIHMRKILPLLLCKQLYDEQKDKNDETTYLNIIIDEAHNILSRDSDRESEQWKDYRLETFEEIIKEGRKFGVFLTIASQRPSDISSTIISQLHNYFLHRLINNNDILAVEKTISYLDKLSFEYLPILPTGTCILAGLTAQVPVVIDIGKIEDDYEPNNKTRSLINNWK